MGTGLALEQPLFILAHFIVDFFILYLFPKYSTTFTQYSSVHVGLEPRYLLGMSKKYLAIEIADELSCLPFSI